MKKKEISKIILKISEGLAAKVVDFVLMWAFILYETAPFQSGTTSQKLNKACRDMQEINYDTLKRGVRYAQEKGWITEDLRITKEGRAKLESLLPKYQKPKKWNGNWYLVSYDIPEYRKKLRNLLRVALKRLGFGQAHKSLWISPYNFLGEIDKIVKEYNLGPYVILAISDRVGTRPSKVLAEKVWGLNKINEEYKKFIEKAKSKKLSKMEIAFLYLSILRKDPQLPNDLLPEDWQGEQASKIYSSYT